jgi:hypothetical protein
LERLEVKVEKIKEDHARHNSGGARRAIATSLDDEFSESCNSNIKKFG